MVMCRLWFRVLLATPSLSHDHHRDDVRPESPTHAPASTLTTVVSAAPEVRRWTQGGVGAGAGCMVTGVRTGTLLGWISRVWAAGRHQRVVAVTGPREPHLPVPHSQVDTTGFALVEGQSKPASEALHLQSAMRGTGPLCCGCDDAESLGMKCGGSRALACLFVPWRRC